MSYTLNISLALGSTKTGLSLAAQLVDSAGADSGSEVDTGFTEIGNGNYLWNYSGFPTDFRGGVKFYVQGFLTPILAFTAINPEEGEYTNYSLELIHEEIAALTDPREFEVRVGHSEEKYNVIDDGGPAVVIPPIDIHTGVKQG